MATSSKPSRGPGWIARARRLVFLVLALGPALAARPAAADSTAALAAAARRVLHEVMAAEGSWVKIHAAEALLEAGEASRIHAIFTAAHAADEYPAIRIGRWRVLARTAPTIAERAEWVAKIEGVYLDPQSPDHLVAIETLGKLHHRVAGPALELVRQESAGAPSVQQVLALWAAQLAGEPGALGGLIALLSSPDPILRGDAAYALRWLGAAEPAVRQALAGAAAIEPAGTYAQPYILGAAVALEADAGRTTAWLDELEHLLLTGSTDARFEAAQTLCRHYPAARASQLATLLDEPANDARVGAAQIILSALARR